MTHSNSSDYTNDDLIGFADGTLPSAASAPAPTSRHIKLNPGETLYVELCHGSRRHETQPAIDYIQIDHQIADGNIRICHMQPYRYPDGQCDQHTRLDYAFQPTLIGDYYDPI